MGWNNKKYRLSWITYKYNKRIPWTDKWFLIWAKRQNWAFVTTHFEPTKNIDDLILREKSKWAEIIKNTIKKDKFKNNILEKEEIKNWFFLKKDKINPDKLSSILDNSILNWKEIISKDRLDGLNFSKKEAITWKTKKWTESIKRIIIWKRKNWNFYLIDATHLLEAYRRLKKEIDLKVLDFENNNIKEKFLNLWKKK